MDFQRVMIAGGIILLISINSLLASIEEANTGCKSYSSISRLTRETRGSKDDETESSKASSDAVTTSPSETADDDDTEYEEQPDESHNNHPGSGNKPSKPIKGNVNRRIIIEEQFSHRNWSSQWVHVKNANRTKIFNKFSRIYVRKSNHSRPNYGLITNNRDGEFYMMGTTFPPFNNRNDSLVIQFSVQFQSRAHCQLAFLRLYDCHFTTEDFGIHTPYLMQVGPHICGTTQVSRLSAEFQEPGRTTITSVDKELEPVNNTSVNIYALSLEPDGGFQIFMNNEAVQNGTLQEEFENYRGYTSFCGVGMLVWHSVLDKYFKGQIILDDILVVNDYEYAEKQRKDILNMYAE